MSDSLDRRRGASRRKLLKTALGAGLTSAVLPMINFGRYQVFAATPQKYSARAVKLVERSLVIDMLAPLKLDFTPEAFALPASDAEVAMFRSSGITGFHNSIGLGGPTAVQDALEFLAAWQGMRAATPTCTRSSGAQPTSTRRRRRERSP